MPNCIEIEVFRPAILKTVHFDFIKQQSQHTIFCTVAPKIFNIEKLMKAEMRNTKKKTPEDICFSNNMFITIERFGLSSSALFRFFESKNRKKKTYCIGDLEMAPKRV